MLERTDVITNEVLEPITFVLAYPTVCVYTYMDELKSYPPRLRKPVSSFTCCFRVGTQLAVS
jgi:hypothetical protein